MSTVLWANHLLDGKVTSDRSDKAAMHKHLDRLDAETRTLGLPLLSSFCDSTDARFNLSGAEVPDGMDSTDEVMAVDGVWVDAHQAIEVLEGILSSIRSNHARFEFLRNDHDDVVAELEASLVYARGALEAGARFNLAIVM